jgi:hypothetical protein
MTLLRTTGVRLLLLALFMVAGVGFIATPASATFNDPPWTSAGAAATVDEDHLKSVNIGGSSIGIKTTATLPATVQAYYNVVAVPGVVGGAVQLKVRYQDNGPDARVVIRLKEYGLSQGTAVTRLLFDSDTFPQQVPSQVREVHNCSFGLNFQDNAYALEAILTKSTANGTAQITNLQVDAVPCIE